MIIDTGLTSNHYFSTNEDKITENNRLYEYLLLNMPKVDHTRWNYIVKTCKNILLLKKVDNYALTVSTAKVHVLEVCYCL